MQTFKLSPSQVQTYFAIRIFGIVHLLGAIGLAILIDGVGPVAFAVTVVCLGSLAFLGLQLFTAAGGKRIFGHYVLTQHTLAVKRPGQPRQFIHRHDCTGFVPDPWILCLRGGHIQRLKLPGMGKELMDQMGHAVGKAWWPQFHAGVSYDIISAASKHTPHEVRVDFRTSGDTPWPHLVFRHKQGAMYSMMDYGGPLFLLYWFFDLVFWGHLLGGGSTEYLDDYSFGMGGVRALMCVGMLLYFIGLLGKAARQRFSSTYYVLSRRGLAVLTPRQGWSMLRPVDYFTYVPFSGRVETHDGRHYKLAGPLLSRPPLTRMLHTALTYWDLKADKAIEKSVQHENNNGWILYVFLVAMIFDDGRGTSVFDGTYLSLGLVLVVCIGLIGLGHRMFVREAV